jgi:hypothetical protein
MMSLHNRVIHLGNDVAAHCTFHVDTSLKVNRRDASTLSLTAAAELALNALERASS